MPLPAARAAFSGLIDYAGLFPPAQLSIDEALADYGRARKGRFSWMLGRFIVTASRLPEVIRRGDNLPLSIILDGGKDARAWFGRVQTALAGLGEIASTESVRIEALEVPLPELQWARETYDAPIGQCAAAIARSALAEKPCFVEIPRNARRQELLPGALASLQRHRLGAKIRCGGLSADSVPPIDEIASFLAEAGAAGVAFKATAGLHHPVRGYDEERGFVMHGFLNLLIACALIGSGRPIDQAIEALEDQEAADFIIEDDALRWKSEYFSAEVLEDVRRKRFVGYGSCSFEEPIADLLSLGMIA